MDRTVARTVEAAAIAGGLSVEGVAALAAVAEQDGQDWSLKARFRREMEADRQRLEGDGSRSDYWSTYNRAPWRTWEAVAATGEVLARGEAQSEYGAAGVLGVRGMWSGDVTVIGDGPVGSPVGGGWLVGDIVEPDVSLNADYGFYREAPGEWSGARTAWAKERMVVDDFGREWRECAERVRQGRPAWTPNLSRGGHLAMGVSGWYTSTGHLVTLREGDVVAPGSGYR